MVVTLKDGRTITDELALADAHPGGARPFARAHYVQKFRTLSEGILTAAEQDRFLGAAESLPDLGDGGAVDGDVRAGLREAHDRLRALADGAEPALQPVLAELNEKIGIVRIRADGNTYEAQFGEQLTASYERVLEACTTR